MKTALQELRELRNTIKAAEARIDQISDQATEEAVAILSNSLSCGVENSRDLGVRTAGVAGSIAPTRTRGEVCGEFTADGHRFQLQKTDVIDMSNYNRYKGEDAVRWREKAKAKAQAKAYSAALTKEMKGITDAFVAQHPDWEPDEIKLTVKVLD